MEAQHEITPSSSRTGARHFPAYLGSGLLSGLLYASGFFAVAFLIPIQYVFSREGKKEGFLSLLTSIVVIGVGNALRLSSYGVLQASVLIETLLPPIAFLLAICIMNCVPLETWKKLTLTSVALSIAFGFMLTASIGTKEVQSSIAAMISQLLSSAGATAGGVELDVAAIAQSYVAPAVSVIMNGFGAAIWLVLAGSWWLGARLSSLRNQSIDQHRETVQSFYSVPSWLLWPSIVSWGLLLIVLYGKLSGLIEMLAWNFALAAASWYAIQGVSVISHFLTSKGMRRITGLMLVLLVALILLDVKVGLAIAILMPVLGVSEVWLQYRIRKGA